MAENSKIEWTHHTFNPWIGCTKVSSACDNCYAEVSTPTRVKRAAGQETWGPHAARQRTKNWRSPIKWNNALEGTGKRERVFCASLADVFDNHKSILPEWREDLWQLIRDTPNLDWLLLTKRPQNIAKMLPDDWGNGYANVWLGTTVEDQTEADRRIPYLLDVPAKVRFLSCEPLLGPIVFSGDSGTEGWDWLRGAAYEVDTTPPPSYWSGNTEKLHWIIAGGESGPNANPMNPRWVENLMKQCSEAGVPFFFKQWGEWAPAEACPQAWDETDYGLKYDLMHFGNPEIGFNDVHRVGKKVAGRTINGRTYDGFPEALL